MNETNTIEVLDIKNLKKDFNDCSSRLIILDYDGTIVNFSKSPDLTVPSEKLFGLLRKFTDDKNNHLVISSGRDKNYLEKWFGGKNITLFAEHGMLIKKINEDWKATSITENLWFEKCRIILKKFNEKTKGSILEVKDYSLTWHYRNALEQGIEKIISDIKKELNDVLKDYDEAAVFDGINVLEIKNSSVDKGSGLLYFLKDKKYDFILCAGDDKNDESMFEILPADCYTIKVGDGASKSRFKLRSPDELIILLENLTETLK